METKFKKGDLVEVFWEHPENAFTAVVVRNDPPSSGRYVVRDLKGGEGAFNHRVIRLVSSEAKQ